MFRQESVKYEGYLFPRLQSLERRAAWFNTLVERRAKVTSQAASGRPPQPRAPHLTQHIANRHAGAVAGCRRHGVAALADALGRAAVRCEAEPGQVAERTGKDGDLPAGTNCATLARYIATVLNGLAVQAASGTTEKELRLVASQAMKAWPS